jgi:hypothetical protein
MAVLDPLFGTPSGGVVAETADTAFGAGSATYDRSRRFRYRLSRVWDPVGPRICFIMLNPSTATASELDPTVSRTVRWAQQWGYGSVEVVNIFALRSTDPKHLRSAGDPIGVGNDTAIATAAGQADLCVAAWGTHGEFLGRGASVASSLLTSGHQLQVLGLSKHGHPRHPLYLRNDLTPFSWAGYE